MILLAYSQFFQHIFYYANYAGIPGADLPRHRHIDIFYLDLYLPTNYNLHYDYNCDLHHK